LPKANRASLEPRARPPDLILSLNFLEKNHDFSDIQVRSDDPPSFRSMSCFNG
jgi:hypothetical protein